MPLIRFPPFVLDTSRQLLSDAEGAIALRPRAFDVLAYLAARPGRLVTRRELLDAFWADAHVSDIVLTVCISELRKALADTCKPARFIETVHRRGYRFVASTKRRRGTGGLDEAPAIAPLYGREAELERLELLFRRASSGQRQLVFVSGEPGIGKTALAETFLRNHAQSASVYQLRGQCVAQHGPGEPYMPVLDGLARLLRSPQRAAAATWLRRHAPSWWAALNPPADAAPRPTAPFSGQQRMLRELIAAIEQRTARQPLILAIKDAHWCDTSTLALVAALARGRAAAKLLILLTYRPVEIIVSEHPLRAVVRELRVHRLCTEMALEGLDQHASRLALQQCLGATNVPEDLARVLWWHAAGNPLFLRHLADLLIASNVTPLAKLRESEIRHMLRSAPASLKEVINDALDMLTAAERRTLECASVSGVVFSAAAIAPVLSRPEEAVESALAGIERKRRFVQRSEDMVWPNGMSTPTYRFPHPFYREVLYGELAPSWRARVHRKIGQTLEQAYGTGAHEVATELATHFAAGGDHERACTYYRAAAHRALGRSALPEAAEHLRAALAMLEHLPRSRQRDRTELSLLGRLGPLLLHTTSPERAEIAEIFQRVRKLAEELDDRPRLVAALDALEFVHRVQGDVAEGLKLAQAAAAVAESCGDTALRIIALHSLGANRFRACDFAAARASLEAAVELSRAESSPAVLGTTAHAQVSVLGHLSSLSWLQGRIDHALDYTQEMLALSRRVANPTSRAMAHVLACWTFVLQGEPQRVRPLATAALEIASKAGLPFWEGLAMMKLGWAQAHEGQPLEGIELACQGLSIYEAAGGVPSTVDQYMLLADMHAQAGDSVAGLAAIRRAGQLLAQYRQGYFEPELHRLEGELRAQQLATARGARSTAAVEKCFTRAMRVAHAHGSSSLELRAAVSLASLWSKTAKRRKIAGLLAPRLDSFAPGTETNDLKAARALLRGAQLRRPINP